MDKFRGEKMGIFHEILLVLSSISGKEEREEKEKNKIDNFNEKYSVSCRRCNNLANPILGTKNRYRCSCGNQFAGPHHGSKWQ